MNIDKLTAPLSPESIEWKVQMQTKDGSKLLVVAYVTNRTIMDRMDEAFSPMGWQSSFVEISDGFLCTLSVLDGNGNWISKTDGANRTDLEPVKGGLSNSMKRCAVQFGLGRSLYDYPKVFIETTDKYLPNWCQPLLDGLVNKINSGQAVRDVVVLKVEHAKK